jgi:N-carbamoyl-L-amino-acid hydrolase
MISIPCRGGKSHAPEEWADPEALAAGAVVMFETVCAIDRNM